VFGVVDECRLRKGDHALKVFKSIDQIVVPVEIDTGPVARRRAIIEQFLPGPHYASRRVVSSLKVERVALNAFDLAP
jgi:hypothetical protein